MALNSATIKSIQDIMRKDAGVDGDAQRLGQLTWLFFLKIFDDREQEWEITVKKYRSPSTSRTLTTAAKPAPILMNCSQTIRSC